MVSTLGLGLIFVMKGFERVVGCGGEGVVAGCGGEGVVGDVVERVGLIELRRGS